MLGHSLITKGFGGLQFTNDGTKTTILGIAGDYIRIGDAGTTAHSLASEDDLMVTGKLEVKAQSYFELTMALKEHNSLLQLNTSASGAAGIVGFVLEHADTNARDVRLMLPDDSGNYVPCFTIGTQGIWNVDLGFFNAVTNTQFNIVDHDADSYISIGFTADDVGVIAGGGSLTRIDYDKMGMLNYNAEVDLTIATGDVAVTQTYHSIIVQGGGGGGNDQLDTATGGSEGDILILKPNTSGGSDTVTVADGTGSDTFILAGGASFAMDHIDDRLMCIHNGTEWVEISRSSNS